MNFRSINDSTSNSYSNCSKTANEVKCKHKLSAVIRRVNKGTNVGKMFYGCPLYPENSCGFFVLLNELGPDSSSSHHCSRSCCEDQVLKLKMKKDKMKKELLELKNELRKHSKGEKMALFGLIFSWVFFCIMLDGAEKLK